MLRISKSSEWHHQQVTYCDWQGVTRTWWPNFEPRYYVMTDGIVGQIMPDGHIMIASNQPVFGCSKSLDECRREFYNLRDLYPEMNWHANRPRIVIAPSAWDAVSVHIVIEELDTE